MQRQLQNVDRWARPHVQRSRCPHGSNAREYRERRHHLWILAVSLCVPCFAQQFPDLPPLARPVSAKAEKLKLAAVRDRLERLESRVMQKAERNEYDADVLKAIAQAHYAAGQALLSWRGARADPDFFRAIDFDLHVFDQALADPADQSLREELLLAAEDVQLKATACAWPNGGPTRFSLTVRTVKDGAEIAGWRVFSMLKILRLYTNVAPEGFPQLSSPTKTTLEPGRYLVWAEHPGTKLEFVHFQVT